MWSVTVYGTPAPKGSLKCVGQRGRHQLVEQDRQGTAKPWRALVQLAGKQLAARAGQQLLDGPVSVEVTLTIDRPPTIRPAVRPWPTKPSRHHGDVDKFARMVLDGLEDSGVFTNDAQVVELVARKTYPDGTCVDRLDRPGAVVRIWRTAP